MLKTGRTPSLEEAKASALEIGIKALSFVAGDPEQMQRFLALSGLDAGQIRAAARDTAFFVGLLDFLLGHEKSLLAFAEQADIPPEAVGRAREQLGGAPVDGETW